MKNLINLKNIYTPSRLFSILVVAFLAGIFFADKFELSKEDITVLVVSVFVLFITAVFWRKNLFVKLFAVSSLLFLSGFIYFGVYKNITFPEDLSGEKITFVGFVSEDPIVRSDKTDIKIKIININDIELSPKYDKFKNSVILVRVPNYPKYYFGDKIEITAKLEKPENFNDFDYEGYLARYNIYYIINTPEKISFIDSNSAGKIYGFIYKVKHKFEESVNKIISEPMSSLIGGILIGSRQNIPKDLINIFNIVGLTHIIAISGYNITIIVKSFEIFSKYLPRLVAFVAGFIGIVLFVVLTGASSSVVRAAILSILFLFALVIGRKGNMLALLLLAGLVMTLVNPYILKFDIGFQLSFLSLIGLIYLSPIIEKKLSRLPKIINENLSATLGAQILTIPIVLANFSRISIVSPIVNVLVLPFVPIIMFIGFVSGLIGMISMEFAKVIIWADWLLLKYIIIVSTWFSKIHLSSLEIKYNNIYFILLYYVLVYIIVRIMNKRNKKSHSTDARALAAK